MPSASGVHADAWMRFTRSTEERWEEYLASFSFRPSDSVGDDSVTWFAIEAHVANRLERLMNVLELAAAVEVEGTLPGVPRLLMRDYLRRMLDSIISDHYTNGQVSKLLQDKKLSYTSVGS